MNSGSRRSGWTSAVGSVRRPSSGRTATGRDAPIADLAPGSRAISEFDPNGPLRCVRTSAFRDPMQTGPSRRCRAARPAPLFAARGKLLRQVAAPLGRNQGQGAAAIGHQEAPRQALRPGDHPRVQQILDAGRRLESSLANRMLSGPLSPLLWDWHCRV
jgi:hypothetical protein